MKKLFVIAFLLYFNNFCHIPQIVPFESESYESFQDECPHCERIYEMHNSMKNLDQTRHKVIDNTREWLKKSNLSDYEKLQIQRLIDDIESQSNNFVQNLRHNAVAQSLLNTLSTNIYKLDLMLPSDVRLEQQDYFENLQQMLEIYNQLNIMMVPSVYDRWLAKRNKMQ